MIENPIKRVDASKTARKLLPSVTDDQLKVLLTAADNLRDKRIISLLFDSGLRLNEICTIKPQDVDWDDLTIKVIVKGNREAKAAFTSHTAELLKEYLNCNMHNETFFGMNPRGIQDTR